MNQVVKIKNSILRKQTTSSYDGCGHCRPESTTTDEKKHTNCTLKILPETTQEFKTILERRCRWVPMEMSRCGSEDVSAMATSGEQTGALLRSEPCLGVFGETLELEDELQHRMRSAGELLSANPLKPQNTVGSEPPPLTRNSNFLVRGQNHRVIVLQ